MAEKRKVTNTLALAVMGLLQEKPMHPYEMASTLRERQMDTVFKLRTGTLYDTVEALSRNGWIEPHATQREGNRPRRTVYAPTDHGQQEFLGWLDEIIRTPAPEYLRFLSAVSYLGALGPQRAEEALNERSQRLREQIEASRTQLEEAMAPGDLPRLFMIEVEYALHMAEAELAWTRATAQEIRDGSLVWPHQTIPAHGPRDRS
ncbi:DNA-binding PadR family transcriptional regulator [Nocardiopsis mwathae]|uniref:DNA-binding PadR family transcriptional regulator n=1 Tax=Nocardiopsis mwathae TaxID=1472723 RepID=A0A7X0D606_9ACTN|nr:PadR family transcriptional regulator [Nocardiopsis mwathae]MBB6171634.1 DNA-binding PadR family transcriptional regulator [Nocardiopsis mwathae]